MPAFTRTSYYQDSCRLVLKTRKKIARVVNRQMDIAEQLHEVYRKFKDASIGKIVLNKLRFINYLMNRANILMNKLYVRHRINRADRVYY